MNIKRCWLVSLMFIFLVTMFFPKNLLAGTGSDEKSKSMGLGLEGGYALLSEDNFGSAPVFGLSFFYNLGRQFRVELKGAFCPSKVEGDPQGLSKGTLKVIPLQLSLQYRFKISRRIIPYLGTGVGYYINTFSLDKKSEWESLGFNIEEKIDRVFGFHFGLGIDFFFKTNMAFFIDARYCNASLTGSNTITEESNGISHTREIEHDLNHLLFGAGIKFQF